MTITIVLIGFYFAPGAPKPGFLFSAHLFPSAIAFYPYFTLWLKCEIFVGGFKEKSFNDDNYSGSAYFLFCPGAPKPGFLFSAHLFPSALAFYPYFTFLN